MEAGYNYSRFHYGAWISLAQYKLRRASEGAVLTDRRPKKYLINRSGRLNLMLRCSILTETTLRFGQESHVHEIPPASLSGFRRQ
jgi:hypothetical protein